MRKRIYSMLLCLIAVSFFTSCVSKKKFNELLNDKAAIDQMLSDKEQKVKDLEASVADLEESKTALETEMESETTRLNGEIGTLREDLSTTKTEMAAAQQAAEENAAQVAAMQEGLKGTFGTYAKSGLNLLQRNNMLYINSSAPIQYNSGSTRIDEEGKQALSTMAEALKNNPDIKILVEGHTDNVPLKEGARFKNNVELSYARANRVVRELVKMGVNANQLSAVGRGEKMPIVMDENDSAEAKAMNRRTEFVVVANVGNLYELSKGM